MKKSVLALAFLLAIFTIPAPSFGFPPIPVELPPASYADTETTVDIPFSSRLEATGHLEFTLSGAMTASNNVEIVFGTDSNENGILEPEEFGLVVGWDCGNWFARIGADGEELKESGISASPAKTLSWQLNTGVGGATREFIATAEGRNLFAGLPKADAYNPSWNLIRVTGRGFGVSLERFSIFAMHEGLNIIMR